jgi:hypothetical protein
MQMIAHFADGYYRGALWVAILEPNTMEADVRTYSLNIPEEKFESQAKVSLSATVSLKKRGDIRIVVFQPYFCYIGDKSVKIQP